jgi:hypothetical protein
MGTAFAGFPWRQVVRLARRRPGTGDSAPLPSPGLSSASPWRMSTKGWRVGKGLRSLHHPVSCARNHPEPGSSIVVAVAVSEVEREGERLERVWSVSG